MGEGINCVADHITTAHSPPNGNSFFQVIYCERLLCLAFILYINAYLLQLKIRSNSTFYATLFWALIGIYIKDIAILLFIIPPASIWAENTINILHKSRHLSHYLSSLIEANHSSIGSACSQ